LNNPRQLSLVYGRLYVAEAGHGGRKATIPSPEGTQYVGFTGSITAVDGPNSAENVTPNRVVKGLLSGAQKDGSAAVGSDGVSATRSNPDDLYVQMTFAPPDVLPEPPGTPQDGRLLLAHPNGSKNVVADISAFEIANDPDGQGVDSDPYAVLARGRGDALVADAAGNDVLRVAANGTVHLFHVFDNVRDCKTSEGGPAAAIVGRPAAGQPKPGCQWVPTSLARDAGGNIYVGGLVALAPGKGQVVKLSPDGSRVLKRWRGFTAVTGVAVHHGDVYVSQLFADNGQNNLPGKLTKVSPNGSRTSVQVPFPAGVAVSTTGNVFVSAFSVSSAKGSFGPGTSGQVWRLRF
jgi:hypothetical protein